MKKLATRVFIVVFFLLSLGLSFTVSAEKIRPGKYTRETRIFYDKNGMPKTVYDKEDGSIEDITIY